MHDMLYRGITIPKTVGKLQRNMLGQTMNERFKNTIEEYKKMEIDILGIILKGLQHHGIFNNKIDGEYKEVCNIFKNR